MASVFLSYCRDDAPQARSVALALEKAGHAVWWDRRIAGGAEYGSEIEQALKQADAVVVLWSAESVRSAWVRDEAAAGRDAGKMVPALLDKTEPPLGFRQYQAIDLSGRKGRLSKGPIDELDRAIQALSHGGSPNQAKVAGAPPRKARSPVATLLIGVLAVAAILVTGWFVVTKSSASPESPLIAVAPADQRAATKQLARDLFIKLGMLPNQGQLGMRVIEGDRARQENVDFWVEIGAGEGLAKASVILLSGRKRMILWAKDLELPPDRNPDLKEQAAYSAARVLGCAVEFQAAGIGDDEALLKRYLQGCSVLAESAGVFVRAGLAPFRQVTRARPEFEEGWSKLLLTEVQVATAASAGETADYERVRRLIAETRKRFPNNAAAYFAEIEMKPIAATAQRLKLSETAVRLHPANAFLLQQRALHLFRVGQVQGAIDHIRRASEADPLSARMRSDYIAILAYAGLIDRARQELAKAERLWPGTFAMLDASSRIHQRFGDPKRALEILDSGVFGEDPAMKAFLLARIDPTPAKIDRAIAETRAMFGRDPRALGFYMQAMGAFGRENELFDFLARWNEVLPVGTNATGTAGVLFRAPLRKFRQDPRFIAVADRFGLVDYWRASGKWPDFCFEPDLPYDCKVEAAKLG